MPSLEIFLLVAIFLLSLWLLFTNFKAAISLSLFLSILLHKEFFSIYRWDVLPVRVFMLALSAYVFLQVVFWIKSNGFKAISGKIIEFAKTPFILFLTLYWLVAGISLFFTENLSASLLFYAFLTTMYVLGLTLYLKFKDSNESVVKLIKSYFYILFGLSLFGFVQLFVYQKTGFIFGAFWNIPGRLPRIGATFWDVNHFAALLASLLPVLGMFILVEKSLKQKSIFSLMMVVMSVMLVMTNSRSAWIIAAVALLVFGVIFLIRKWGYKSVLGLVLVLTMLTVGGLVEYSDRSSPFRAKIKDYFHYRIDSFESHFLLLRGAFEVFEMYPYFGGGVGGFFEQFSKTDTAPVYFGRDPVALTSGYRAPGHSIWGELAAETGGAGIFTFTLLMFFMISTLLYIAMTSKEKKTWMISAGMTASLIGWLVGGVFYSYKAEFFWLIFFLYFLYGVSTLGGKVDMEKLVSFFSVSKRTSYIILSALGLILLFVGLGKNHLIPWDEAIYAKIAKNIVNMKDFITLRWMGDSPWYEKPPLYMWLSAGFMKLLGISEFATRLPSAIFGFSTVILIYKFGKEMFGKAAGFIAALALVTTTHFIYYARASMLDVSVTFFITAALYYYWRILKQRGESEEVGSKSKLISWVLVGIFIGGGAMIKNVVGMLPFVIIGLNELYLLVRKEIALKSNIKNYLTVGLVFLAVFLPWHILMLAKFGRAFVDEYFIYHVFTRGTMAIEDKGQPFLWYLVVLKVSMRIWFIPLLAAFPFTVYKAFKEKSSKYVFMLIWSLVIFLFFSAAKSKLVWYIIPLYPVLVLMVGEFIDWVVNFLKLKFSKPLVFKAFFMYSLTFFSLFYLFLVKGLVYTSDLTGDRALVLQKKDELFGVELPVYADRIELPLVYFYTEGPYVDTDSARLKRKLQSALYEESVVFITKEGRYTKLIEDILEIDLEHTQGDYILGFYESEYNRDIDDLELIDEALLPLLRKVDLGLPVLPHEFKAIDDLTPQKNSLEAKIKAGLKGIDTDDIIF